MCVPHRFAACFESCCFALFLASVDYRYCLLFCVVFTSCVQALVARQTIILVVDCSLHFNDDTSRGRGRGLNTTNPPLPLPTRFAVVTPIRLVTRNRKYTVMVMPKGHILKCISCLFCACFRHPGVQEQDELRFYLAEAIAR